MSNFFSRYILLVSFCALAVSGAFSQAVSFTTLSQSTNFSTWHADFNSDGREDFITFSQSCAGFEIVLSTGNGIYNSPVCYKASSSVFAVGDFNSDGNADLIVGDGSNTFYEYLGSRSGALHRQSSFVAATNVFSLATADVNHDGKIDLLFAGSDNKLHVWFGNGNGGFAAGPQTAMTPLVNGSSISVGDFDGDGKVDVLNSSFFFTSSYQVFYGDGTGHFQATPSFDDNVGYATYDLNGDGRMDLVGIPFDFSTNGTRYYQSVKVLYGNANRTFTTRQIALANCNDWGSPPAVADFNGDGVNDIVVIEASDCNGTAPDTVNVLLGNPDGTYQAEQAIHRGTSSQLLDGPIVLRADRNSKPDFVLFDVSGTLNEPGFLFQNTTIGGFPSCSPPNHYTGITLCAPTSTVAASSPVKFSVGAANQTPGRKVEVWIDGKKMSPQLKHAFSYYSFLNASYSLAAGKHNVTVFSAGWDNLVEKFSFPLTVGSSTCAFPSTPGVNVCSPLNNATVGPNVLAWASGTVTGTAARMEVWVDGAKKATAPGRTLKTTLSLGSGTHKFTYFIVNTAGQKWQQTVFATVP